MKTLVVCSRCESLNRVDVARTVVSQSICGQCMTSLPIPHGV